MSCKPHSLVLDYSTSNALQMFFLNAGIIDQRRDVKIDTCWNYHFGGDIASDVKWYLFGDLPVASKDDQAAFLKGHFRNFYGILSLLTLYDEIIIQEPIDDRYSNIKGLDLSKLEEIGIKTVNSLQEPSELIVNEAWSIITRNVRNIFFDFEQEAVEGCGQVWAEFTFDEKMRLLNFYKDEKIYSHPFTDGSGLSQYEIFHYDLQPQWAYDRDNTAVRFYNFLYKTLSGIITGLQQKNSTFFSNIIDAPFKSVTTSEYENLENIVFKADLSSGVKIIPVPESFDNVLAWRNDPNMVSFRRVFSEWMNAMQSGDIDMTMRIRKDVENANSKLQKINAYKRVDNNTFVVIIKYLLGMIPVVGNLLSIADFIKALILDSKIDSVQNDCKWVMLPGFQKHYNSLIGR